MTEFLESPVSGYNSVEQAAELFREIMAETGLKDHTVKGWSDIPLSFLSAPEAWLSIWMLKSDEMAVLLTGSRLWDCLYIGDSEAIQSISPVNRHLCDDKLGLTNRTPTVLQTYDRYPLVQEYDVPLSLRKLISKRAFLGSLIVEGPEVSVRPINGFYEVPEVGVSDKEIFLFPDESIVLANMLSDFSLEANQAFEQTLSKDKNHSL